MTIINCDCPLNIEQFICELVWETSLTLLVQVNTKNRDILSIYISYHEQYYLSLNICLFPFLPHMNIIQSTYLVMVHIGS
jgi:hypothetical protein